jgi:hypothetical protein
MNNKNRKPKKKVNEEEKNLDDKNIDENFEIKRKHTKYAEKKKENKENKIEEKKINEINNINLRRKVKFGNIDIIDVESWKAINLKLTSEENIEELFKISDGKENRRIKDIGCACIII